MTKILYEDEQYIAASKPSGLLTHPSNECRHVKESLLFELRDITSTYLYPVNRLDRAVSGINLFSKTTEGVTKMQAIWPKSTKLYYGLVRGQILVDGQHNFDLNNEKKIPQKSVTNFKVLELFEDSTLLEISIETGRRHQIRRHFSRRMQALLGDRKYGKKKWNDNYLELYKLNRIFLHSKKLEFTHPYTNIGVSINDLLAEDLQLSLNMIRINNES